MRMMVITTHCGGGGPEPTMRPYRVYAGTQRPAQKLIETSMPICPICNGTGERLRATDTGLETACPMCLGRKQIPRPIYDRIVLELSVLSLLENVPNEQPEG